MTADSRVWDSLHNVIIAAILSAPRELAEELVDILRSTTCNHSHWTKSRFSIALNVIEKRPDVGKALLPFLRDDIENRDDPIQRQLLRRHELESQGKRPDRDPAFRRMIVDRFQQRLEARRNLQGPSIPIGGSSFFEMSRLVSWHNSEPKLIDAIVEAIDSETVLASDKFDYLAFLGEQVRSGPVGQARKIAAHAVRWLEGQIPGRELGPTGGGPMSRIQISVSGRDELPDLLLFVIEQSALRCPEIILETLSNWLPLNVSSRRTLIKLLLRIRKFEKQNLEEPEWIEGSDGSMPRVGFPKKFKSGVGARRADLREDVSNAILTSRRAFVVCLGFSSVETDNILQEVEAVAANMLSREHQAATYFNQGIDEGQKYTRWVAACWVEWVNDDGTTSARNLQWAAGQFEELSAALTTVVRKLRRYLSDAAQRGVENADTASDFDAPPPVEDGPPPENRVPVAPAKVAEAVVAPKAHKPKHSWPTEAPNGWFPATEDDGFEATLTLKVLTELLKVSRPSLKKNPTSGGRSVVKVHGARFRVFFDTEKRRAEFNAKLREFVKRNKAKQNEPE